MDKNITILGAGMAGFGAANMLYTQGVKSVLYEKLPYHGGHTASFISDGFVFDDGPHISFTKNERIQKLFAESVNHEYEIIQARAGNYWNGHWIKHPAQCNLYDLPENLVTDILCDFIHAQNNDYGEIANYKDWLYTSFGKTFAETFPMKYGLKFHTTTADNMSTEWVDMRLYRPDLREIIHGILSPKTPDVHYVSHFRYPLNKGFVSYLNLFLNRTDLRLNHELIGLDLNKKELRFSNGSVEPYDEIVSSIPLPELIPKIAGVPADVLEASQRLACTTCVIVNIGLNRRDISDYHWIYFYDQDICFTRLSFPHMQSPQNVLPGAGSIQAEIYFSDKYLPMDRPPQECIQSVVEDLHRCGLLNENDKILYKESKIIPYANVIFDLERSNAIKIIHEYLDDVGIHYCGRYGEWGYHWTDESFISGENVATAILDTK